MFRESDYVEPQLHPSYRNKPRPLFQVESQLSKFDSKTSSQVHNGRQELPPQVPTTYDTIHDPSHPDADWTGLVSKERIHQKKHVSNHRSQQVGIVQTEEGIVSIEEKAEFARLRRASDVSNRGNPELIGGISTRDHYQTNYQRQTNGVKTTQDQLTIVKQAGHRKAIPDPAQAASSSRHSQSYQESAPSDFPSFHTNCDTGGANGYSYRAQPMGTSLIKNLGASIASRVESSPSSSSALASHPYHTTTKTLLADNYNTTPGYTGKRRPM